MRLFFQGRSPWSSLDIVWFRLELQLWPGNVGMENIVLQLLLPFDRLSSDQYRMRYGNTLVTRETAGATGSLGFDVAPENSSTQVS